MKQENGVYQLESGTWAFVFSVLVDGKRVSKRKAKDDNGNPFRTKKSAMKARERCIKETRVSAAYAPKSTIRKTVKEVYEEYREKGCEGKAYATLKKQDSLWKNHLCAKFGNRYVDEISVAEIVDYLTELYYVEGRAYKYVESFLKMFYLIFGQAYGRNYLDVETYSKLCTNKGTKIHMPKRRNEEEDDIAIFSKEELAVMDDYFKGSNAETAYFLGRYCGLRINECFGLRWENVDIKNGTILIDRQMQYQEGLIKLVSLKTRNAKRTVYMCDVLKVHFQQLLERKETAERESSEIRKQNQTVIADLDGSPISSLALVNALPNGKIQTVNSMKYHSRTLKEKYNINFKFHYLRHTYGTFMAEMNTPQHLLCNQMGHASIKVTQKYYIGTSQMGVDILRKNLNQL